MSEDSTGQVIVARPGVKGLLTGIAPEDAAVDFAVDMWNMRADQLGKLCVRPGYEVYLESLDSGNGQVGLVKTAASHPDTITPRLLAVTLNKFYSDPVSVKIHIDNTVMLTGSISGGTINAIAAVRIDTELTPINLIAIDSQSAIFSIFAQYQYESGENDASYRIAVLPIRAGPDPTPITFTEPGAGTFLWNQAYEFKIAAYNSKTGDEGPLSANSKSHTVVGIDRSLKLNSVPVVTAGGDEKADMHRRIYCDLGSGDYRLIGTIADNITTDITIANAPTEQSLAAVYQTAPPMPEQFVCMEHWLGHTWIMVENTLYWSLDAHACMFDTNNNKIPVTGRGRKLKVAHDRLYVFTDHGVWYVSKPSEVTLSQLRLIKVSDVVIEPQNIETLALCRDMLVFRHGKRLRTVSSQGEVGEIALEEELRKSSSDHICKRNLGFYDSERDKYLHFTVTGPDVGLTAVSAAPTRDVYGYDFGRRRWDKDNYRGLYPCSVCYHTPGGHNQPILVFGGAYGVIAYMEGGADTGSAYADRIDDGADIYPGGDTATGGGTTYLDDTGGFFTVAIGGSCVVYRASADTDGNKKWQLMGVAPVKSIAGTRLTFGHSIGFTVAAGDKYYIGAIPWLIKTPALRLGNYLVRQVEVEHDGALTKAVLLLPLDVSTQTGWMDHSLAGVFQQEFDDARSGLNVISLLPQVAADAPQVQLCGYRSRPTITEIRVHLEKMPYV